MLAKPLHGLGGDVGELRALRRKIDSRRYAVDVDEKWRDEIASI